MKISLGQQDGIAVLEVKGAIDIRNLQVLKAGLSKLLRDGRNRIILNLEDSDTLDSDVIREIAILNVFARELAGQILITSTNETLKENILNFSKPPVVPFLPTIALAVEYFQKQKPETEDSPEDAAELRKKLELKEKEVEALLAKIKMLDPSELQRARSATVEAQARADLLKAQLEKLLLERRAPVDASGFIAKIDALEETVKKLSAPTGGKA
jgi:anti-anti-sigma factor